MVLCLAVYLSVDRGAPVFDFTDAASVYSIEDGASLDINTFLKGVKATDRVDGDLTDRIAIKSLRQNADSSISVIYCVRDNAGNLTTEERIYNLQIVGDSTDADTSVVADETETTQAEPVQTEEPVASEEASDPSSETETDTEPVTDTDPAVEGDTEPESEPETDPAQSAEIPVIVLNASEAHISVGTPFDYAAYIAELRDDVDDQYQLARCIRIEHYELVDTNTAGAYELIYHVVDSDGNVSEGQPFTLYVE
jgi:hypothetical protein